MFVNYTVNKEFICIIYKALQKQPSLKKLPVKNGLGI